MKNSMMDPEKKRPAMMAPPRPRQRGSERVMGTSPTMAANEVRAMGSSRLSDASTIASRNLRPLLRF